MFDKSVDAVKGLVEACKGIDELAGLSARTLP